jgi:hypothetical protein
MPAVATAVVADAGAATKAGVVAIGISLKHALLDIQYVIMRSMNRRKSRIRPSLVGDKW